MNKESHPLDDFFRESLRDLKVAPSAPARSRFLEEATRTGGTSSFKFWRWFNSIVVAIVLTSSVILYFHFSSTEKSTRRLNNPATVDNSTMVNQPVLNQVVSKPAISHSAQPTTNVNIPANNKNIKSQPPSFVSKPISSLNPTMAEPPSPVVSSMVSGFKPVTQTDKAISKETALPILKESKPAETITGTQVQADATSKMPVVPETSGSNFNPSEPTGNEKSKVIPVDSQGNEPSGSAARKVDPVKVPLSQWMFSPYIKYSFDWVLENQVGKIVNSLGLEGELKYGRFSVSLGGGISATSGYSKYQVSYNDYLGKFKKLDSITFAWDDKHYHLVPSYYLSENKVWDSTIKTDYYQVSNKYRLIRIPLMLGYDFIERERFSIGLKAGVAMVFCLDTRKGSNEYAGGQNRMLGVTQENADYSGNNYYLLADLYASYYLSRRLVLDLEPHFDYLLNPAGTIDKSFNNLMEPGIRISLKYKF
jgi:hypothetical protein